MGIVLFLSIFGFILSCSALRAGWTPGRKWCDFSSNVSCTAAFRGRYSGMLGIKNSLVGMFAYSMLILLYFVASWLVPWVAALLLLATIALAYLLYFRLKNFCVVCTLTHIVNLLIFAYSI